VMVGREGEERQGDLPLITLTNHFVARLAHLADRVKHQRDEHGDDSDHREEFEQGKCVRASACHIRTFLRNRPANVCHVTSERATESPAKCQTMTASCGSEPDKSCPITQISCLLARGSATVNRRNPEPPPRWKQARSALPGHASGNRHIAGHES